MRKNCRIDDCRQQELSDEIARLHAELARERMARDIYENERGLTPFSELGNAFAYYELAQKRKVK